MENKSSWTLFQQFGLYIIAKIKYSLCRWKREWDQSTVNRQLSDKNSNSKQSLKSDAEWVPWKMEASLLRQTHVLKAVFETVSLFFTETFSWVFIYSFSPLTFYFFNSIEVRNYRAILQWHITSNENLNNFKCNLKIRATSTGELGKLEW